ncbi:MAG: ketoacyl-ACP synthase III [Verrucomicrobia bacterium]|nr:ketoacyl-ACP synthase III [Cytophagales bacterium]
MTKITAAITGVHGYVPDYILTNAELETLVDTTDEWITTRTGIKERRLLKGEGLATSYMGAKAAQGLLEKTNTDPADIDLVIIATATPDYTFPATANLVATEIGAVNAFSYDLMAACSGFLYAITAAAQYIESGRYKKIIVIGVDKMSSILDYTDRTTCIIFGDGGGAVLIEPNHEGLGIQDFELRSDGVGERHLMLKGGGSRNPSSHETVDKKMHFVYQEGAAVFKYAVSNMAEIAEQVIKRNHLTQETIAFLVPHQANKRIIDATTERIGLPPEKVMMNIHKYGNTTNGCMPLCLWEYEKQLKKGDNLIFAAFGGGFTWGAAYIKWAY